MSGIIFFLVRLCDNSLLVLKMHFKVILWQAKRSKGFPDRNSCPEGFCKKDVLRNFTKFAGKHLSQSLFFNKASGLQPY